jgi:hypothetical protein
MTLGQFAAVVGAPPRWVQNARAVLRLRGRYSHEGARQLGLARTIAESTGMPLQRAWPMARAALRAWPASREYTHTNPDGSVRLVVDVERYLAAFAARLSLARTFYAERAPGRRPARPRNPIRSARQLGVDVTLFEESLKLTPAERLRRMDEMSEFLRTARVLET